MNCRVAKLYLMLLSEPSLDFLVAAKALRLGETVFQDLHYLRRNRLLAGLRSRIFDLLDLLDPSLFIEPDPIGNGMAMDAQLAGRTASAFGLSGFQKQQHVEAAKIMES